MRRLTQNRLSAVSAAVLVLVLGAAPAAGADVGATIIERCTHGQSLSGFSQQDYSRALQELPTEVEEYSDCANLIRRAQLAAAGGAGAGGPGGGAGAVVIPLTPAERRTLTQAIKGGSVPVRLGSQLVSPGVVHANISSAVSTLPDPLLAILAFLLACALLAAGGALRNRVRSHRPD
jgi:hypothetical protein